MEWNGCCLKPNALTFHFDTCMELIYGPKALDCMSMVEVWHNHGIGKPSYMLYKISLQYMNT